MPLECMQAISSLLYFIATVIAFCLFWRFCWRNQSSSAALTGSMFIACAILSYLPHVAVLKAFGIEFVSKQEIQQVDDILKRIKSVSTLSVQSAYRQAGEDLRLGLGHYEEARQQIVEAQKELTFLDLTVGVKDPIEKPFFDGLAARLFRIYEGVMKQTTQIMLGRLQTLPEDVQTDFHEGIEHYGGLFNFIDVTDAEGFESWALKLHAIETDPNLPRSDAARFRAFANQIEAIYRDCQAAHNLTLEATSFLNRFDAAENQKDKARELLNLPKP